MDQLFFATVVFAPPAAMLLVARTARLGVGNWVASLGIVAMLTACIFASWSAVAHDYTRFGESEGNGSFAFACTANAVWLTGAAVAIWMVLRARFQWSATQ